MDRGISEPCHTSKMELFAKIVNDIQPFTIFAKSTTSDVLQGSEYASDGCDQILPQVRAHKPSRKEDSLGFLGF